MDPMIAFGQLSALLDGFRLSQCVSVAAQMGISDAIGAGPTSTEAIADSIGANPDALRRLLRALASAGVFASAESDAWIQTPPSELLRADHPLALRDRASALGTLAWAPWGELRHCVTTGAPAFDHIHGTSFFAYLQAHAELAGGFQRTMASFTRLTATAVTSAHDFSGYRHLVDIGGGSGALLDVVLGAHPSLRATLVDRPEIVGFGAPELAPTTRSRVELVAADFFLDDLPGGDALVLSWILHDWDDPTCIRLLTRCAAAMTETTDLLVVEMIIPTDDGPSAAKMFDLEMMVQTGGRERSEAEYRALLAAAGLTLVRRVDTAAPHSVLVARRG